MYWGDERVTGRHFLIPSVRKDTGVGTGTGREGRLRSTPVPFGVTLVFWTRTPATTGGRGEGDVPGAVEWKGKENGEDLHRFPLP